MPQLQQKLVPVEGASEAELDGVFFALSDPVRRAILSRLGEGPLLVSELAKPFAISLQAVSRHIQVLAKAGLVRQERTGRISRCSIDIGPIFKAAIWINGYTHYWQAQFETLAALIGEPDKGPGKRAGGPGRDRGGARQARSKRARSKSK